MKIAVSIPDPVFKQAERLARRSRRSRSELYRRALEEYIARHAEDPVTEQMNQVCDQLGVEDDGFPNAASRRILERSEW